MPARTTRPLIGEASIADPPLSQNTVGTQLEGCRTAMDERLNPMHFAGASNLRHLQDQEVDRTGTE
jgi:hypothetical protein